MPMHDRRDDGNRKIMGELAVLPSHHASRQLARGQRACARAEEQREQREHLARPVVYGRSGEKYHACIAHELGQVTVPPCRLISYMMRLVDDDEVLVRSDSETLPCSTEPLKRNE